MGVTPGQPSLSNKVAIVTGGSRGIGAAIVLELAKRGAKVAITYTSESSKEGVKSLVAEIGRLKNGCAAISIQCDLRDLESPNKIVQETQNAFGAHIDILVNNAGTEQVKLLQDITLEDYNSVMDLNLRAPAFMIQAVLPHLRAPGRIINISSVGARCSFAKLTIYSASKAALEGLTRSLAAEIGDKGHTVNAVEPGPVKSDMFDRLPSNQVELQRQMTAVEHRIGDPEDVALVVAWLAEGQSRWISGQTISASGGYSMV